MSADLERLLEGASRRLAWSQALRRAGWVLLIAAGLVELVWLSGLGAAATLGAGLLALAAAGAALVRTRRRPSPELVAAVVDARVAGGGAVAAAAEALRGLHPGFASLVRAEAQRALTDWTPARLVPLRSPPGLLLGAASLVLLPALLGGRTPAPVVEAAAAPSLLSPAWVTGGGDEVGGDPSDPAPLELTAADAPDPDAADAAPDPLDSLAPELAALLRERLGDLARAHGTGGAPAAGDGADDDFARSLQVGDPQAALDALDALAAAAAAGDQAAARRLEAHARRAGAGGGDATAAPDALPPTPAATPLTLSGGRRAQLPRLLETTRQRYFASLTRSTP